MPARRGRVASNGRFAATRDTTLSRPDGELQPVSPRATGSSLRLVLTFDHLVIAHEIELLSWNERTALSAVVFCVEHAAGAAQVLGVAGFEEALCGTKARELARLGRRPWPAPSSGGADTEW